MRALDRFALLLLPSIAVFALRSPPPAPGAPLPPPKVPRPRPSSRASGSRRTSGAKDLVLLDARPMRDFLAAHLPGAQSVAVENLRSTAGGVPATTYPPEVLGVIFARAGVRLASHVVVYGAESDTDATYVATAARIAGAAKVSVLDGGFSRWTADARPRRRTAALPVREAGA